MKARTFASEGRHVEYLVEFGRAGAWQTLASSILVIHDRVLNAD